MNKFLKLIIILLISIFSINTFSEKDEFKDNSADKIKTNPYKNNKDLKNLLKNYKVDEYLRKDSNDNGMKDKKDVQLKSTKQVKAQNKSQKKVRKESDVPDTKDVNEDIDKHIASENENSNPISKVLFDTSGEFVKIPSIVQSIKLAAYMMIINGITRLTGLLGSKVSTMMGLFIVAFATLQLIWNTFTYYVSITKQEQPVNISGYLAQQIPYIVKVAIISTLLLTNLYWYFYAIICKNLFIYLGGIFGGHAGVTYTTITTQLIKLLWMPVVLILKSLVLAITIIPIFTGTFWFILIFGFGLMGLVGRAVTEFVVIVVEYMIVGVFSIVVIPLALLDFTRSFGGKIIGAMIAAGVNLIIATALISFITRNANAIDLSFWTLIFDPNTAYFNMMILFLLITLLTKAKTIGNFVVKGQGNTVKGSEMVTEGIMVAFEGIASVVSIATTIAAIVATAGAASAAVAAKQAAAEAVKQGAKEAAKAAIKEGAKQVAKEVGKEAVKEGVKKGVKDVAKDVVKDAIKNTMKDQLKKIGRNRMIVQTTGNVIKNIQANEGAGGVKAMASVVANIMKQQAMNSVATGSTLADTVSSSAINTGVDTASNTINNSIGDES